jgi:hypothetical protein
VSEGGAPTSSGSVKANLKKKKKTLQIYEYQSSDWIYASTECPHMINLISTGYNILTIKLTE